MKIFKVYYEATIGAAYVKAKTLGDAIDKLNASTIAEDTKEIKFDFWEVEPDSGQADMDSVVELDGREEKNARTIMFEELTP
jgi:hypothetical protein